MTDEHWLDKAARAVARSATNRPAKEGTGRRFERYARAAVEGSGLEAENARLVEALDALLAAFCRMPDAGFDSDDPRWDWWHETVAARELAREALERETAPATKYGWAHADDESACMEPTWCKREHVRTPVRETADE